jgi:phosphatidylglycerol:prolipoprotein diacylglycerol transferase
MAPLIPYIDLPEVTLIPAEMFGRGLPPSAVSLKPFGTLVAIGAYVGAYLALRQGQRLGLHQAAVSSFVFWIAAFGFVGGHVFELAVYYPERLIAEPLSLFELWEGQSSFGGFLGAFVGGMLWRVRHKVRILPYADVIASSFPAAWAFGRLGCSVAHDHPGMSSDAWYAVAYPGGGRFDLGLYELVLTIPLVVAFAALRQRARPWGFYLGVMMLAYAPVRFMLDFLRAQDIAASDARYAALTPAQWASIPMLAAGAILFWRAMQHAGTRRGTRVPPTPAAFRRLRRKQPSEA